MKLRALCLALSATLLASTASFAADAVASSLPRASQQAATNEQVKRLSGGAVLKFSPGAEFEMMPATRLQIGPPSAGKTATHVVKINSGRVDVEVPAASVKTPPVAVLLYAPRKVSAIAKGGHSVAIIEEGRTTFAAIRGEMVTASGNQWRAMASGLTRTFVGTDPNPQERPVPSAPAITLSDSMMLGLAGEQGGTKLLIKSARAARYGIKLWSMNGSKKELVRSLETRSNEQLISDLPPGTYEVSARAFDDSSVDSPESAPATLRVVGANLPEGARFADNAIVMRAKSRVRLIGAEGLEATYDGSTHFVPAPKTVGLARGQATVVRLREPGKTKELRIALEPNTLKGDIAIGPRSAHWPRDTVSVKVRLFDNRGKPLAETVKVSADVRVNIRDAQVSWQRVGNELRAAIPTPVDAGPWVVRVDVKDEFGDPVAHSFLEVAIGH